MPTYELGLLTAKEVGIYYDDEYAIAALKKLNIHAQPVIWDEALCSPITPLLFRSCWDYHRKRENFVSTLKSWEGSPLRIWNPPRVALWNLDKSYLNKLHETGTAIPRTLWLEAGIQHNLEKLMQENDLKEVVVKPAVSMAGDDTWRATLKDAHKRQSALEALSDRKVIVQEFIPEILSEGEVSFVFFNNKFSHAIRKTPAPDEFRIHEAHGGKFAEVHPSASLVEKAEKILRFEKENLLYARIDTVSVGDKLIVMELEFLDPSLYLKHAPGAADRFANAIMERIFCR